MAPGVGEGGGRKMGLPKRGKGAAHSLRLERNFLGYFSAFVAAADRTGNCSIRNSMGIKMFVFIFFFKHKIEE